MEFKPSHRLTSLMSNPVERREGRCHDTLPVYLVAQRFKRHHVIPVCTFDGFYQLEEEGCRRFVWTTACGAIDCRFPIPQKLRYAWLEIEATAPEGSIVTVTWDDASVVKNRYVKGRVCVPLALAGAVTVERTQVTIESNSFVPSSIGMNDDPRKLGVAVRGLVFAKRRFKYRPKSAFSVSIEERVEKLVPRWARPLVERFSPAARRAA